LDASQKERSPLVTSFSNVISTCIPYVEQNRKINGRKFINFEISNDEQELNGPSLQHYVLKHAWKSNFSSPIHEAIKAGGLKVLDVG